MNGDNKSQFKSGLNHQNGVHQPSNQQATQANTTSFTLDSITQAVQILYSQNIKPSQIREVQRWLTKAQRCAQAWQIGFQLLTSKNLNVEVQHFGAAMITEKIRYHFSEIPNSESINLRDQLLQQIIIYSNDKTRRIVLTKLCLALASLASQMIPKVFEAESSQDEEESSGGLGNLDNDKEGEKLWPAVIKSLMEFFKQHDMLSALLDLLTVMAEELRDGSKTWLVLSKRDRSLVRSEMLKDSPMVINLLIQILSHNSVEHQTIACKCFSAWLQLGIGVQHSLTLLQICINLCLTKDPEEFIAFEECCECIQYAFCTPDSFQYQNTLVQLLPRITQFDKLLQKSIQDQNESICLAVTRLICGIGENHSLLILQHFDNRNLHPSGLGRFFIELVMQCTSNKLQYPLDEKSTPLTFSFWYGLQDEYSVRAHEWCQVIPTMKAELDHVFYRLVDVLTVKSIHPDFETENWSKDEREEFRVYRVDVSDTLMYTFNVLEMKMVEFLANRVLHFSNEFLKNPENIKNWQYLESYMTSFSGVAEGAELESISRLIGLVIQVVSQVSQKNCNILLKEAVLNTIGSLTDYIAENPEPALSHFLPIILKQFDPENIDDSSDNQKQAYFTDPDSKTDDSSNSVVLTSILTLKRICREASFGIRTHTQLILLSVKKSLDSGKHSQNQMAWLMQCAGHALSVIPDSNECQNWVENLLVSSCSHLEQICNSDNNLILLNRNLVLNIVGNLRHFFTTIDRGTLRKYELEMAAIEKNYKEFNENGGGDNGFGLNEISSNNDQSDQDALRVDDATLELEWKPLINVLQNVVPLLEKVMIVYNTDDDVIRDCSIFFDRLARNLDQFFQPILTRVVDTIIKVFQINPHKNIIELCEYTSLIHFESQAAKNLLGAICVTITERYSNGGMSFVENNPEVCLEFCSALSMIMRKKFEIFVMILSLNDGNAARVFFEMLLDCLKHETDESLVRTSSCFLSDYWRHACGKHAACKQLGVHYMNQTLNICLAAITGKCTKVCLEYIADLLFQISKASFNEFNTAIREQFNNIFLQNEASNANHFQRYLMQMIKERSNKHRFRENIREWSLLCREILGSC